MAFGGSSWSSMVEVSASYPCVQCILRVIPGSLWTYLPLAGERGFEEIRALTEDDLVRFDPIVTKLDRDIGEDVRVVASV